jgi:hypothetical protein
MGLDVLFQGDGIASGQGGEGDSVTLMPRCIVEVVCCEPEGWRGMQGRVGHAGTSQPPAPNGVNGQLLFCFN